MNTWAAWLEHPVIRTARDALPPGADALDLLTESLRLLNDLDERFPGVKMSEILNAREIHPTSRKFLRERLLAAGASPVDVAILVPTAVDLALTDRSYTDIAEEFGDSLANAVVQLRRPPSQADRDLADRIERGQTPNEVARAMGRPSSSFVKRAVDRVRCAERMATA